MHSIIHLGLDIAKESFELSPHPQIKTLRFSNDPSGCRRLVKALSALKHSVHIICEATAGYENRIMHTLHQAGILVTCMNPRRVRDFARAKGRLAKTDRIDALVLAQYGQQLKPAPSTPASPQQERLAALVRRRDQLMAMMADEKRRQEHQTDLFVRRQSRQIIRCLEKHVAQTEEQIAALIQADPLLQARFQRLCQIKSVGRCTAWVLLAELPELGSLQRGQAAALAGVAPFNYDSGPFRGQRHIAHGRPLARKALYMAALVAARRNPVLKTLYDRLITKGKRPKQALVALMRKLAELANLLLKRSDWKLMESAASSEPLLAPPTA